MTSAETGPLAAEAEPEDGADPADAEAALWSAPWAPNDQQRRGNSSGAVPGAPAQPPSGASAPSAAAPAPSARAPAGAPPASGQPGASGGPQGAPAGPAGTAPADQPAPEPAPAEHSPMDTLREKADDLPVDTDMLADMAPMAMMAGMGLLPMLGSALTGLLGGGAGGGTEATPEGQLSPESQKALEALDLLAEVYGDGPTDDPEVQRLREELGLTDDASGASGDSSAGSGETARMVKARQLFQENAATAFNNLDNQLAGYVKRLAGTNSVDKKEVNALIREVNEALAELGPQAYTKEGQQKVREILTLALRKAHGIVSGGQANAGDTATAIDKLTNQYLYNIAGQEVPDGYMNMASAAGAGGSEQARKALEVALDQIGDPYRWGAEGPDSFDCSGLMQYAAKAAGVNIPRVSEDQYGSLPKVAAGDIQPGDLIFPSSSFDGGAPGHVQMYIGDGQVVHAPSAGKNVEVTALPSSFEATRWA